MYSWQSQNRVVRILFWKYSRKIEGNPEWRMRYDSLSNDLSDDLTDWIINNWIGKYVSSETGMKSLREVSAAGKCSLITSYSKLGW
jgi:hypothetical protein